MIAAARPAVTTTRRSAPCPPACMVGGRRAGARRTASGGRARCARAGLGIWKKKKYQSFRSWLGLRSPWLSRRGCAAFKITRRFTTSGCKPRGGPGDGSTPSRGPPAAPIRRRALGSDRGCRPPACRPRRPLRRPAARTGYSRAGRARRRESRPRRGARSAAASCTENSGTVQQHDQGPIARLDVVQPHFADLGVAIPQLGPPSDELMRISSRGWAWRHRLGPLASTSRPGMPWSAPWCAGSAVGRRRPRRAVRQALCWRARGTEPHPLGSASRDAALRRRSA